MRLPPTLAYATAAALAALLAASGDARAQAPAGCEVRGASADLGAITVAVPGGRPLALFAQGVPASAWPGPRGSRAVVNVRAAIEFGGEAMAPRYFLARAARSASGTVTLSTRASLSGVHARGADAVVDATIEEDQRVVLRGVSIRCRDLGLDAPAPVTTQPEPAPRGDGTAWVPRSRAIALHAWPGTGPSVRIEMQSPGIFVLSRLARRRGWVAVARRMSDGSAIEGWVQASALRRDPSWCYGATGGSSSIGRTMRSGPRGPGVYRGPAEVAPGTLVLASRGGAAWATVRSSDGVEVTHDPGDAWVQISAVRGLGEGPAVGALNSAWVPRAAVVFPAAAGPR